MTLTLKPELQQYIANRVSMGAYRNEDEAIAEAVRALRDRDERAEKRAALIADLERGVESLDRGLGTQTSARDILAQSSGG